MADSGDECDLDALSALLEEDCEDLPSADSNENLPAVKDSVPSSVDDSKNNSSTPEEEDMDLEALSSMLEQDSDLEDNTSHHQDEQEVTAEDIAAFLNDSSDSEHEGEDKEEEQDSGQETDHNRRQLHHTGGPTGSGRTANGGSDSPRLRGPGSSGGGDSVMNCSQQEPEHVKNLQDELVMMQQRMMEIQQMLASSQTSSIAAAVPSAQSVAQTNTSLVKQRAKPKASKMSSTSSPSTSSSSPSALSKTSSGSSSSSKKKVRPPSASPVLHQAEKKQSPGHSSSVSGAEKHKTHSSSVTGADKCAEKRKTHAVSTSGRVSANGAAASSRPQSISTSGRVSANGAAASSRPHGSSDPRRQASLASRRSDSAAKSSAKTKEQQAGAVNSSQSQVVREDKESGGEKKKPPSTFLAERAGGETSDQGQSLKSKLFGDADSDSDWDDMDGEKRQLNSSGQEIKRLLQQGERQRVAHTPSYTVSPSTSLWKSRAASSLSQDPGSSANFSRPSPVPVSGGSSSAAAVKREPDTKDYMTEKFSGLRIINPKVSSALLASKMEGRRLIAPSVLPLKVKCPELQSDWVTIGVIVFKSEARKSQTGKTYSILKLSDLQSTDTTVSFFLFGQVYKQLWKVDVGNVIGVLNPNIMDAMEKGGGDVAFTVNNAQQVMEIGRSKDLGWCMGKTKRGASCTNFINKKMGDFCTYHVQAAYRQQSAKRGELHGSCPGATPKSSLKSKILQNNAFFYGGECYTASKSSGPKGKRDKVTLGKLQAAVTQKDQRKVSTLAIQNLMPAHTAKVQSAMASQHQQPFLEMLSVPTAGSMNLVRHIATAEDQVQGAKKSCKGGAAMTTYQSIKAADLLKQHQEEIAERINSRKRKMATKVKTPLQSAPKPQTQSSPKSAGQRPSQSPRLSDMSGGSADKGIGLPSTTRTVEKNSTPMLGKGFYPGGKIDLFAGSSSGSVRKPTLTDVAKRKAIQKVQAIGGLDKTDPNAVRTATQSTDVVKKRVLENLENEHKKAEEGSGKGGTSTNQSALEPPRKRSRLLGNVDPNSAEVKQLLNARSSHTGALAQAEAEREERYFDKLEKKEMMEEKMKTITVMEVTVVTCEQCRYTAMSQGDKCRKEGHVVRRHKGKRRFFACKKCKHRTVSLHRYPTDACRKCGERSYEKTSMYKEKTGPKMESEILCLRGDESKFTNAMDQKVFMSTIVQD